MKTNVAFVLFLFLNFAACTPGHEESGDGEQAAHGFKSSPLNVTDGYVLNQISGDSIRPIDNSAGVQIQTGKPVPASGKTLDPSTLSPPAIIPATKITQLFIKNLYQIDQEVLSAIISTGGTGKINVTAHDPTFVLKNSAGVVIPTGRPIAISGKSILSIQPRLVKALPLRMKYDAKKNIQFLDVEQGMNSSYIQCMLEDRFGNIWFGTYGGGVTRYDGAGFLHYTTNEGLSDNVVNCILEDRSGNLWFGTKYGGITKYDGVTFTHFTESEGLSNNNIRCLLEDKAGNIWLGTNGGGISFFKDQNITHLTTKEGLVHNVVRDMSEDKDGIIWIGCNGIGDSNDGGVSAYDGSTFKNYTTQNGLKHNEIISLHASSDGKIWIGSEGHGLSVFDGTRFTHIDIHHSQDQNIWTIMEDRNGDIWYGSEKGGVFHYTDQRIENYSIAEGLNNSFVLALLQDHRGNYWFGTFGGGVSRYDAGTFSYVTTNDGLLSDRVWCITENNKGEILLGTDMSGFSIIRDSLITHIIPESGDTENAVTSIAEDAKGGIWLSTWEKGVYHYNGHVFSLYSGKQGLTDSRTNSIISDKSGNLWFGHDGGLVRFDGTSFMRFTDREGLSHNLITDLLEDRNGNIWIATMGGGVSKYDGTHFTHYTEREGLNSNFIFSILEDLQGNLWFGSDRAGVCRFDGMKFIYYTEGEGLSSNIVFSLALDQKQNIWASTEKGLSYFIFENNNEGGATSTIPSDSISGPRIIVFGSQDGLKSLDFLTNSVFIDQENFAWWGGGKSVVTLDLDKFAFAEEKPKIFLRTIVINEKHLDFRQQMESNSSIKFDSIRSFENYPLELSVPHRQNHINFHYSAIDWSSPHQLLYKYRLKGLDDQWSDPTADTYADFRGLAPGDYTFSVMAAGIAQKWSDPLHYPFTIRAPWWSTWWAYLCYTILFALLMIGLIRYRSRHLKSQNIILEKKVTVRTTQLRQSIDDLKAAQAQLIQSEKMASLGQLTAGIAHEIQNPLNFINNFSEVNSELIEELRLKIDESKYDDVKSIAQQIDSNEQKINHHGRRADAIVKGMLQHSRKSTGMLESTNINALADEYLRLAYHGLRAKDKTFEAVIKTDFDESIGMVKIVPQDVGRVLLNLITNAFYAVAEKNKVVSDHFQPTVEVSTRKSGEHILVSVSDNGNGIPQDIADKIFQPFFTTKPTGQGTGLGLSLSYDIIKAHGGELQMQTKEGEGAKFIIQLPLN